MKANIFRLILVTVILISLWTSIHAQVTNPTIGNMTITNGSLTALGVNTAAGGTGTITASGNITVTGTSFINSGNLTFTPSFGVNGTTTNGNALAGVVGEYIQSVVTSGAPVTLATTSATPITFISLTAGDWDVTGVVDYIPNAATSVTLVAQGSQVLNSCMGSPALGGQDTFTQWETAANIIGAAQPAWAIPTVRVSIAATTNVCLVAQDTFTINSLTAYGTIRARRMR